MRVMHIRPDLVGPVIGDLALLDQLRGEDNGWIWIDLEHADPQQESRLLTERFAIHPLAVQDAQRERHPPKLEVFRDFAFLLMKGLTADTQDIRFQTLQIAAFIGDRFLITRRSQRSVSIDGVWNDALSGEVDAGRGPAHVLYRIARRVTDRYTKIVLGLELRLDELEDEMFQSPDDRLLAELTEYNSRLKKLRRVLTYQQSTMSALSRLDTPACFGGTQHEFNDVYENTERLASLCTLYQELAVDLMQSYISVTSHRLNQIIKLLTIVTVIFLPLGLIAGLYGMNFEYMPGAGGRFGFALTLGAMSALAVTLLLVFRRLHWV
jgi:magnesium transporter